MEEKEILGRLRDAIVNCNINGVKEICKEAINSGIPAYKAVVEGMANGMRIVGQKYESKEYFLAELIMAGETMKEGMEILEPYLKAGDIKTAGKIIIGTVKGDLHDIGKNLVIILLKAAGFDVIDLGVDVSAQIFVEAVKKNNPDIVGMSALLKTMKVEMESTIKALQKANLRNRVKIIIGGAPITPEYAEKIGADAACRDALKGVKICELWVRTRGEG